MIEDSNHIIDIDSERAITTLILLSHKIKSVMHFITNALSYVFLILQKIVQATVSVEMRMSIIETSYSLGGAACRHGDTLFCDRAIA